MNRVPAVRPRDYRGRFTAVEAITQRHTIPGRIERLDQAVPSILTEAPPPPPTRGEQSEALALAREAAHLDALAYAYRAHADEMRDLQIRHQLARAESYNRHADVCLDLATREWTA